MRKSLLTGALVLSALLIALSPVAAEETDWMVSEPMERGSFQGVNAEQTFNPFPMSQGAPTAMAVAPGGFCGCPLWVNTQWGQANLTGSQCDPHATGAACTNKFGCFYFVVTDPRDPDDPDDDVGRGLIGACRIMPGPPPPPN